MHNNYYFLRQFSARLKDQIKGWQLAACFSQQRDELILGFCHKEQDFFLKATLTQNFSGLSTSSSFSRARRNSINLWENIIGQTITDVVQHLNERSFYLQLSNGQQLLFKMFGNRANVVLFENNVPVKIFNNQLKNDWDLRLSEMNREIYFSEENFLKADKPLKILYPTFGDMPIAYLNQQGFSEATIQKQWQLLSKAKNLLENPDSYYLIEDDNKKIRLSLLPVGKLIEQFSDPLDAANQFARLYLSREGFQSLYQRWHSLLKKSIQQSEQFINKNSVQLQELQQGKSYSQIADVIMANLHQLQPQTGHAELYNFYTDQYITVKFKQGEAPQKLAEKYYRKAKQQPQQIARLKQAIEVKENLLLKFYDKLDALEKITDLKALKVFVQHLEGPIKEVAEPKIQIPFKIYHYQGFDIWVGRSARNNDLLTQKFAHKDDIWLHAKDVPGSHVVIRHRAGHPVPQPVLETAAQLAAWHSKRRTDSLCPVSYTPKKFVRKRKGSADGEVVVEREKVLLVNPTDWPALATN